MKKNLLFAALATAMTVLVTLPLQAVADDDHGGRQGQYNNDDGNNDWRNANGERGQGRGESHGNRYSNAGERSGKHGSRNQEGGSRQEGGWANGNPGGDSNQASNAPANANGKRWWQQ